MMNGYLVAAAFSAGVKLTAGAMLILFAEKRHKRVPSIGASAGFSTPTR